MRKQTAWNLMCTAGALMLLCLVGLVPAASKAVARAIPEMAVPWIFMLGAPLLIICLIIWAIISLQPSPKTVGELEKPTIRPAPPTLIPSLFKKRKPAGSTVQLVVMDCTPLNPTPPGKFG